MGSFLKKYAIELKILAFCVTVIAAIMAITAACGLPWWGGVALFLVLATVVHFCIEAEKDAF